MKNRTLSLVLVVIVSCIYLQNSALEADNKPLQTGTFETNVESLKQLTTLSDSRCYNLAVSEAAAPIPIENLSAAQAEKGTNWFSNTKFWLEISNDSINQYLKGSGKDLLTFLKNLTATNETMYSHRFPIKATFSIQQQGNWSTVWDTKILKILAPEIVAKANDLPGRKLLLAVPQEDLNPSTLKNGDTVFLEIWLFSLLDAYGSFIPKGQETKPISIYQFFTSNNRYLTEFHTPPHSRREQPTPGIKINSKSGVAGENTLIGFNKNTITIIADWAFETKHINKRGEFEIALGLTQSFPPFFFDDLEVPIQSVLSEISLLDAETRFPKVKADRLEDQRIADAEKAQTIAAEEAKKQEEKEKLNAEKAIRMKKWGRIAAVIMILSITPLLSAIYISLVPLHRSWRMGSIPKTNERTLWISIMVSIWLGIFCALGATTYGADGLIAAWIVCGFGGAIAMIVDPNMRSFFSRSLDDRVHDAVEDAVTRDAGTQIANMFIRIVVRYIVLPLVAGGIVCVVLWIRSLVRSGYILLRSYQLRETNDYDEKNSI